MLKRKIDNTLRIWKENKNKKPIIIEGARQIGKTYSIKKFGNEYYGEQNVIYINLEFEKDKRVIFDGNIDGDSLYSKIKLLYRNVFRNNKPVLLILDEVQSYPIAITALKALSIDGRLDVIATGSLLGVSYTHVSSFPVGYVDRVKMYPLDFEEFLWAQNFDMDMIQYVKQFFDNKEQVPEAIHKMLLQLFNEFMVVGGMPEIVNQFSMNRDFEEVLDMQNRIVNDYRSDIAKYAEYKIKSKSRECFDSIPAQLGKDNKKFQYKYVKKGGRSSMYDTSINWLVDAGLCHLCYNVNSLNLPFEIEKKIDVFKVYLSDVGLLVSIFGERTQTKLLFGELGIHKGAIYENVIATQLMQKGYPLYYFHKTHLELDFLLEYKNVLTAIEVKSSDNTQAKSLKSFRENYNGEFAIKLSQKNVYYKEGELRLPLYMILFL